MFSYRSMGLAVAIAALILPASALAQATRTWVSGVGDDANPCSRTAPCKTFAGAISKTATGGEIDALDPGGFGAVTITKSITLDGGEGQVASVLVSGTNGIIVNVPAGNTVTIRNIRINGILNSGSPGISGITLIQGGTLNIEHCEIFGFGTHGINIVPTVAANVSVTDTRVVNNQGGGLAVTPSTGQASVVVDNSRFEGGQFGVRINDNVKATVSRSVAFNNSANGFSIGSSGAFAELTIDSSVSSNNGANGVSTAGANAVVRISNMTIMDNTAMGINSSLGGQIVSFGNNRVNGNTGGNGVPTLMASPI